MTRSFEHAFLRFAVRHQLIQPGRPLGVAVSGGVDSVVLLHLLHQWRPRFRVTLHVLHVHHGLRGQDADEDLLFVEELAQTLRLPFSSVRVNVAAHARAHRLTLEEAGRELREQAFRHWREVLGLQAVATAHHLDDQVETIFMRLLRGTGVEGLAGIRLRRQGLIRPLLFARKQEILQFAHQKQLAYREDPSNRDLRFLRNRIRLKLIPFLEQEFSFHTPEHFLHLGLVVQDWLSFAEAELEKAKKQLKINPLANEIELDMSSYFRYFSWIQIRLLEHVLQVLLNTAHQLPYRKFDQFVHWAEKASSSGQFLLHPRVVVVKKEGILVFRLRKEESQVDASFELLLEPGASIAVPGENLILSAQLVHPDEVRFSADERVEYLDADLLSFPLKIRPWKPGDKMVPLGMKGTRPVSDLLAEHGIYGEEKKRAVVVLSGSEIVAVPGVRISEKFKVGKNTRRVLKLQIERK